MRYPATGPQFTLAPGGTANTAAYDPRPSLLNLSPVKIPFIPAPIYNGTVSVAGNGQGRVVTKAFSFKTPALGKTDSFGISFNLQFTAIEADDQTRLTVNTGSGVDQKEVFVMTGEQLGTGLGLATLSLGSLSSNPGTIIPKVIEFSVVPSAGSQCRTTVNVTNIKQFIVPGS